MQEQIKEKILHTALNIIPFSGWNNDILKHAGIEAKLDPALGNLVFPGGVEELLDYFCIKIDRLMIEQFRLLPVKSLSTHLRISECLKIRLKLCVDYKLVMQKAFAFCLLPWNYSMGIKILWRTIDLVWYEAGYDKSTDFSYYTKRAILAEIYSNTLLYWFVDNSANNEDTFDFLVRKLNNVIKFMKSVQCVKNIMIKS